jgi:hypothetical protein
MDSKATVVLIPGGSADDEQPAKPSAATLKKAAVRNASTTPRAGALHRTVPHHIANPCHRGRSMIRS